MSWYIAVLKNYVGFIGRARRKEYWMFYLFHMIILVILSVLDFVLSLGPEGVGILYPIYMLASLLPFTAVSIRRLHDVGKSGWFLLILFIPFIGAIWLLILFIQKGSEGDNRFGPNPKAVTG